MNKKYRDILHAAEFSLTAVFFLIPPIFVSSSAENKTNVQSHSLMYCAMMIGICAVLGITSLYWLQSARSSTEKYQLRSKPLFYSAASAAALMLLFMSARQWSFFSSLFGLSKETIIEGSPSFLFWAGITVTACYEEICYRLYLPSFFTYCVSRINYTAHAKRKREQIFNFIAAEIMPSVLFALAHRYAGFFAVINAFAAAVILRMLMLSSKSVIFPCAVHTLYNVLSIIFFINS